MECGDEITTAKCGTNGAENGTWRIVCILSPSIFQAPIRFPTHVSLILKGHHSPTCPPLCLPSSPRRSSHYCYKCSRHSSFFQAPLSPLRSANNRT